MIALDPQTRAQRVLDDALATYRDSIALACSFGGPSGMVLVDMIARRDARVPVYFLDTGLLFDETYALVRTIDQRYGIEAIAVKPDLDVAQQNARYGEALWARDPDTCCDIRKVRPQRRFLEPYSAWITGIRRDQSATRGAVMAIEPDPDHATRVKIAPLADWTSKDIWSYIAAYDVPYNSLNDRGYPSVGCTHCTRAIVPGEDQRAGRWSGFAKTECGLHAAIGATGADR